MDTSANITVTIVLSLAIGVSGLVMGILVRLGVWKLWFVTERVPAIVIPSFSFGLIPAGLAFSLLGVALKFVTDPSTAQMVFFCVIFPLGMTSVVLAIWQPWWVKPTWCRWLEQYHSDIIPFLQEEARAMGRWKWQRRVATQEGLEQWVAEVRQKRGLD
jgi:hypothetical protein